MKYSKGYKYRVEEDITVKTKILGFRVILPFCELHENGDLDLLQGYAWDGASGPTKDTKKSKVPSAVHDAFYQMMRKGLLPEEIREAADTEFLRLLLEKGMWSIRAKLWYKAVRAFAGYAADAKHKRTIYTAP
jgi:hypothetical protein